MTDTCSVAKGWATRGDGGVECSADERRVAVMALSVCEGAHASIVLGERQCKREDRKSTEWATNEESRGWRRPGIFQLSAVLNTMPSGVDTTVLHWNTLIKRKY